MLRGPFRAGPWPGLTGRGALVLLACAVLLAIGEALVGAPRQPLWDVPLLGGVSLVPLLLATWVVRMPGVAAAVCGAYLLPRSLLSLVVPALEPPALLLVPAIVFDSCAWLRRGDLADLRDLFPRRRPRWRRIDRTPRQLGQTRQIAAGAAFGAGLAFLTPPWALFLGAPKDVWSGPAVWLSVAASAVVGGVLGGLASAVSARGTGSPPRGSPTPPRR